ncbi:MAG: Crp/Fnr family transcriptional regulator [Clostridiales bacterium]|nr:Crp/Fnr family transcriptional regulator [Clostridiales bacterium]
MVLVSEKDMEYLPKTLGFWDKLTQNQKDLVMTYVEEVKYNKGERIHGGGVDCVGVLLIKKGHIRVYILSDEGKEVTLYRLGENDICILSASCVISQITFDVHIDAEADCEVLKVSPIIFERLCRENVYVENFTNRIIIDHFSESMWAMQQILFMSFDKRLAIFLYDEITRTKKNKIKMTHEQIAKYIGSAREVVTRMLNYFAEEDIVRLSRGVVEIIDKKKLQELTF